MKRLTCLAATVATVVVSLSLPGSAGADMRAGCPTHNPPAGFRFKNGSEYIENLVVHHMTCGQAIHDLHDAYLESNYRIRTAHFNCRSLSHSMAGGRDRCARVHSSKTFSVTIYT
jgi:hypothetical protein